MTGPRLSIIPARAATDRALKPRDLQVLCVLGRHTDELGWCTKSQVKMSVEMGCARSTVFEAIERLVAAGYLERHVVEQANGRDAPHIYRVILDPVHPSLGDLRPEPDDDSDADTPADQSAPPAGISAPPAGSGPAPKNDPLRTNLREGAREDRKKIEAAFWRMVRIWPQHKGMPTDRALRAFLALSDDERAEAERKFPHWLALLKSQKKDHTPAPSTYFEQKLWTDAPEPVPEKPKPAYAPAFGPVWAAIRMRDLVTGPKASPSPLKGWEERAIADGTLDRATLEKGNVMRSGWPMVNALHFAAETRGLGIHDFGQVEEELGRLCEFVPVDSSTWAAWKAEHDRRGWPWLPDPGSMRGVYFPAGGPDRLAEFEQALRGNDDAGGREAAE